MTMIRLFGTLGKSSDVRVATNAHSLRSASAPIRDPGTVTMTPATLPASPPQPFITSPGIPSVTQRSPEPLSPQFVPRVPEISPPPVAPTSVTTAQDILANVLHRSPPRGSLPRPLHMRQVSAPQTQNHVLFGSNALGTGPSIWSSTANETGSLSLPPSVTAPNTSYQAQQFVQGQLHASPPQPFPGQSSLGLGHPSMALGASQHINSLPFSGGFSHQRVQSLSMSHSQPSSQGTLPFASQYSEPFGSYPALTEQTPVAFNTGVPGAYADPVYSRKMDSSYLRQDPPGVPDRSVPYHLDPRASSGHQNAYPPISAMAQLWNNVG